MTSTRSEGDDWDLASSVGTTATMVAAARAMASRPERGLIDDPYAEPLVRAVGIPFFTDMLDGRLDMSVLDDSAADRAEAMIAGMALRTRFFDDYCLQSAAAGVRQVVILASGLDSRAYRLPWQPGTVVYEIDQPAVIDFKTAALAELGAQPTATRTTVGIDLRGDWPAALRSAGFDPAQPTAWLAEGLLIYLPGDAQDRLVDTITALSAAGSMIATEYAPGIMDFDSDRAREMSARFREHGLNIDMPALVYPGPRSNVMDYLRDAQWKVTGVPRTDLFTRAGLPVPDRDDDPLGEIVYVSAAR